MVLKEIESADLPFLEQMSYLAGYKNSGSDPDSALSFEEARKERGFQMWVEDWGLTGDAGYIAMNGVHALGAAWYRLIQRKIDPSPRHIVSIAIQEHAQNKGIGSLLLPRLIQRAADENIPVLGLTVLKSNTAGQALYQKVGFTFTGYETETLLHMDVLTSART